MSNFKRIIIGIVILAIVGVCVYLSIQILNMADSQTGLIQTVRLNELSMFEDTPILNKERVFYIPVLTTPTLPTTTLPTTTVAPLKVDSSTDRGFVLLNNYSIALN